MNPRLPNKVFYSLVIIFLLILVIIGLYYPIIFSLGVMPLILILPGYALTIAAFPSGMLNNSERLTMALGFGFSVTIISGLLLFWLRININTNSWAVTLSVLMLLTSLSILGGRKLHSYLPSLHITRKPGIGDILLLCLAALIFMGAFRLSRNGAVQQPFDDFTQLWILPATLEEKEAVQIGILSGEREKTSYSLQIEANNQIVAEWEPITLERGESWETTFELPMDNGVRKLVALLFNLNESQSSYREAWLWFGY